MDQLVVICDDLTGAMEAGLQLNKTGLGVYVVIDESFLTQVKDTGSALVIDTESRNVDHATAKGNINSALMKISETDYKLVYKKVDSTLRGNLGLEMEAVLRQSKFEMIVFCPALPFNGRTIKNGVHYLNGIELVKTDIARDPFSPVSDSYIPNIIKKQTLSDTRVITLEQVRQGAELLAEALKAVHSLGCKIASVDAETEDDLSIIASALKKSDISLLPCGSAGLFSKTVLNVMEKQALKESGSVGGNLNDRPVVVLSGSPANSTKEQIRAAAAEGYEVLHFDIGKAQKDFCVEEEIESIVQKAALLLKEGKSIIIDGAGESKTKITDQYNGNSEALFADSKKIQEVLSGVFKEIIKEVEISGVMIIGGDTVINTCREMGVKAVKIVGEVEPFIPVGGMVKDKDNQIPLITKSGAFGSENIIIKSIKYLKEQY